MEGESRPNIRSKGVVDGHVKKPKRKFILNVATKIIGFFDLKITINKDVKSIGGEERINHKKSKEIEVESPKLQKKLRKFVLLLIFFLICLKSLKAFHVHNRNFVDYPYCACAYKP
jgi:hypothetical protein